jgi:3-hydroxyisobutyrate dehydrogenase-like beta-hydroxyacid dehydrogenase
MKAVNNSVLATCNAAVAEGLALVAAYGVPPDRALEALAECSINVNAFEQTAAAFRGDWDAPASFRLALQRKDMRYAARLAAELGVPHPVGDAAHGVLLDAERAGFGDADWSQGALRRYGLRKG